jgi:hypothetical protein
MGPRNQTFRSKTSCCGARSTIQTTLYQLIEAVSEALPFGDDAAVSIIVGDILNHFGVGKGK